MRFNVSSIFAANFDGRLFISTSYSLLAKCHVALIFALGLPYGVANNVLTNNGVANLMDTLMAADSYLPLCSTI